ncbi:MAG: hypothetical protein ACMG6S_01270 [Byssovorax sp.]
MLAPRWLLVPFAITAVVGLACAPTTRTYENTGGQGSGGNAEGGGSSSGMCAPGDVEDCFNGADDDCNGKTDCEDPACNDIAVCEPLALAAASGVVVAEADPCPDGYTADEQLIHRKLADGGCAGCDCNVPTPTCTGEVSYYDSAGSCKFGTNAIPAGTHGAACSANPIASGFVFGVLTSAWKIQETCSASGTATPVPAAWGTTVKFCRVNAEGKGCGAGNTCVKKTATAPHCALAAGSSSCTGFATAESDWYTGSTDSRTCGACGCKVSGGSCDPVLLAVGSDYACYPTPVVKQSSKQCFTDKPNGIYSPPVQLVNKATIGTCTTSAPVTGSLDPTGQSTLCCQP